ncbi:hypothetical protein AB0I53_16520 [Saccharopolyspora sp. NPDC050389]|uniref:hypothetical protein n=1 Tax=Saccharopolyspora sp. NPDC050389 TaxID=3155516 RepID=UPI0033E7A96C
MFRLAARSHDMVRGGERQLLKGDGFGRDRMPLDTARTAFAWLVTGPHPVCVDGRLFAGLPDRLLPLNEVRDLLLRRRCGQGTRDAVWAHLVLRSRTEGATWTVGCVGVALPGLTRIAARLSARFAGDVTDIHAAVLAGFLAELPRIDLRRPRIMLRLRWAAYRAGHASVREALDAPVPSGSGFRSAPPSQPWGHPDFVLARAVAEAVLTAEEAELIGSTRLEGLPLAEAARQRGVTYEAMKKTRRRAELRLLAYLCEENVDGTREAEGGVALQVGDTLAVTFAAQTAAELPAAIPRRGSTPAQKSWARVSRRGSDSGVQGCGGRPAPSSAISSPAPLTQEAPRCA